MRLFALLCLLSASAANAQITPPTNSKPVAATAKASGVPEARDIPYPGTLEIALDTTDNVRGIFKVRQRIPVTAPGELVMLFPEWIPGNHKAAGEIAKVAGVHFSAGGKPLAWRRNPLDVYAFHVDVPAGVRTVDLDFEYISATAPNQGRIVSTPQMQSIRWWSSSMYPAGYYVRNIPVRASVTVPQGWTVAAALRPTGQAAGNRITFDPVSYQTLIDSPMIAGRNYRRIPLKPNVNLEVIADNQAELAARPEHIAAHRSLVDQALKLYGAEHFDHYDFLLTISDSLGGAGLEHHRSSENGVARGYFTDWAGALTDRDLLPHEYVHSWNGKFRLGRDLWTPDYRMRMENSLLWVYEGQTQFYGFVLAARSGMWSKQETLDAIASTAAAYGDGTPGRSWRTLVDTTNDPIIANRAPQAWRSWQRSEDYYSEGLLIWLDVDRIIRQQSGGARSLDDFARAFFGMRHGDWGELPYDLNEIIATLNRVQPYDWAGYLNARVYSVAPRPPLEGITQGGYRLVYREEPTAWTKSLQSGGKYVDLTYSIGASIGNDGKIRSVLWDSPAFRHQLTIGQEIAAVNGQAFSPDSLRGAIAAAKASRRPIVLLVKHGDQFRTVNLEYYGGLRFPALERVGSGPSTLDALLAPRS
jgi:predicted metalloprotease with PDZ domain